MSRARSTAAAGVVLLAALVGGCGDEVGSRASSEPPGAPTTTQTTTQASTPPGRPTAVPAAAGEVTTVVPVTVLDDGGGAELCLGGVLDSYPPQCGGPRLVAWDWADHDGQYDTSGDVRWGDFVVTGTFDGTSVTPSEVRAAAEVDDLPIPEDDDEFATPCAEPAGGWQPTDPAKVSMDDFNTAMTTAEQLDGYAATWVDQSINPVYGHVDTSSLADMGKLNDPALEVLNVTVTHDADAAERQLRAVYGGPLCVTVAAHSARELQSVAGDMEGLPGVLSYGPGIEQVEVSVTYDDGSYQAWADAAYGAGVVLVSSALVDVTDQER
ncbi:hypothetical protein [Nocardioides halotolerans]|uniref:hypothetical protein n=1 Tax=Nocardioides halotolerans TaxID=433660 RepID=UPI00042A7877|nr:hypothetical protein [Nocardioides halotolerans]